MVDWSWKTQRKCLDCGVLEWSGSKKEQYPCFSSRQGRGRARKHRHEICSTHLHGVLVRLLSSGTIGAITHRLCRLIWKILHERVRYEERGPAVSVEAKKIRARKMIRELRSLGYRVELLPAPSSNPS